MIIGIDFETYYDKEYSLTKLTTQQYIADPRFEVIGAAFKIDDKPAVWLNPDQLKVMIGKVPWHKAMLLAHNVRFDGGILQHYYGVVPAMYLDTMAMAQVLILPYSQRVSLAKVAEYLDVGKKGDEVIRALGKRLRDFTPEEYERYGAYSIQDIDLTFRAFQKLKADFPQMEYHIVDMAARMYLTPRLKLNGAVLHKYLHEVVTKKQNLLARLGLEDAKMLNSSQKLAQLLIGQGVNPPMKISKNTGKPTFAFAKTDKDFVDLLDHEDIVVQALVAARLGTRSTLEETRTQRLIDITVHTNDLRVPLKYGGAHTLRFSGEEKINLQNLGRTSELRNAIEAPPGHKLVAVDASQIEARILATMAGQKDLVDAFENGIDVYAWFAERIYRRPINKDDDPTERFVGKVAVLSLGYGSGHRTFQGMVHAQGGLFMDLLECSKIVNVYRDGFPQIRQLWTQAKYALADMHNRYSGTIGDGPIRLDFSNGRVALPNGLHLHYPKLYQETDGGLWYIGAYGRRRRIYGPMLIENIVQALARITTMEAAVRIRKKYPQFFPALQVHDELVYVVKEDEAEAALKIVVEEMSTAEPWAAAVPLAAEGHIGDRYGECK